MIRRLSGVGGATLFALALTILVTWPQVRFAGSMLASHHDPFFSIWRLAWVAHALSNSPGHLFDANIFSPAASTLAYSDATMLQGLIGAPFIWAGAPPVLVYNVLLLVGFVGSGTGMFVLARHVTGATGPALVAVAVFTMAPYRIEHLMHLELQWAMFIPLTWWALHRAVESTSWRYGVLGGLFLWLQVLSCVYYGVFLAMSLVVFVPALVLAHGIRRVTPLAPVLTLAALVAVVLTWPYAVPYQAAAREVGSRDLAEIGRYSATVMSYLSTSAVNRLWGWTADRWGGPELRLFPGAVALLIAACSVFRRPSRPVLVYAATGAVLVELSFGLNGWLYRALLDRVDALSGFRSLSRFAILAQCALAVLAGLGTQAFTTRLAGRRSLRFAVPLLVALMTLEYGNRAIPLSAGDPVTPPDAYKLLRRAPAGVVLELPVPRPDTLPGREPFYQAWSLWHWRPLVNGYSGYYPRFYLETLERLKYFPDDASVERLRTLDVRYVLVHREFYDPEAYTQLVLQMARRPDLKPWGAYKDPVGMADIFELIPSE